MKEITINGRTLQYQTLWDGNEAGEWCWTEFYDGTVKIKRKKFVFFGKVIEEEIPITFLLYITIHRILV